MFQNDQDQDFSEVMADPEFLQQVLSTLPGVDPNSEAIRNVVGTLMLSDDKDKDEPMEEDSSGKKNDKNWDSLKYYNLYILLGFNFWFSG